jgi:hypothetical protein
VTLGALLTIFGSTLAVVVLVNTAGRLHSQEVTDALTEALADPRIQDLRIGLETARDALRYLVMVLAVLSVASLVLAVFVLRGHRGSRVGLTAIGCLVAVPALFAGIPGWLLAAYIGICLWLLWTRPSRRWFVR